LASAALAGSVKSNVIFTLVGVVGWPGVVVLSVDFEQLPIQTAAKADAEPKPINDKNSFLSIVN
jgi:hypothetical protein